MAGHEPDGSIGALILAAGANTRLQAVVPPYMKPLILMNGKPLVRHAVDHALNDWHVRGITVVAGPDNARMLLGVLSKMHHFVLQPEPDGVVDAVYRALPTITQDWTLILCADNTFVPDPDNPVHFSAKRGAQFGTRFVDPPSSRRFTRYKRLSDPKGASFDEQYAPGVRLIPASDPEQGDGCWIGPLLLETEQLRRVLGICESVTDMMMQSTALGTELSPLPMLCSDLGIPEELL